MGGGYPRCIEHGREGGCWACLGCRFTGSSWGALMMGWGMLLAMTVYSFFPWPLFSAISVGWFVYLATVLVMNARAHKLPSPLASIFYLRP